MKKIVGRLCHHTVLMITSVDCVEYEKGIANYVTKKKKQKYNV